MAGRRVRAGGFNAFRLHFALRVELLYVGQLCRPVRTARGEILAV